MEFTALVATPLFKFVLLPLAIVLARITDVSIGTIRVIFISRGMRSLAPVLGFFEVLIWIVAISQIMNALNAWYYYIAYAGGFALGTWIGMWIESKLALGIVSLRVVTQMGAEELLVELRRQGYGVTAITADGARGPVKVLYTLLTRQTLDEVIKIVKNYNPHAFYFVEDVRYVREGIFPKHDDRQFHLPIPRRLRSVTKKK